MALTPAREIDDHPDLSFEDTEHCCEFVATPVDTVADYDRLVAVDAIHDGWIIPERFVRALDAAARRELELVFRQERDWGSFWIARRLAEELQLSGVHRVAIARALLDFNRFPGTSRRDADHLGRFAINPPFDTLTYGQKAELFARYYDSISDRMERTLVHRSLKIAVHTYDPHNVSGTQRPPVSLITRPESYQMKGRMKTGAFDPLFPSILGEFMCSRILVHRVALAMERRQIPVAVNFPYLLPDGSVEVRSQVWFFFDYLQRHFEESHTLAYDEIAAYNLVWTTLRDTNMRASETATFREYLHRYRHAPAGLHDYFERARAAYDRVHAYLDHHWHELVDHYRYASWRPSSLAVEIRKDFLFDFDSDGRPRHLKLEAAERAVTALAEGIRSYVEADMSHSGPE